MIHWEWLILVSIVAALAGFFGGALCRQGSDNIEE